MVTTPGNRLAGLFMMLGAALAIVVFFIRPGSVLIRPPEGGPLVSAVNVLADYAVFTHLSALAGSLGAVMILFGFLTIRHSLGRQTTSDALARFGILFIAIAVVLFIAAAGLNHMIAHLVNHGTADGLPRATLITQAVHLQSIKLGLRIIGGYAYILGFLFVAVGLCPRFPSGILKVLSAVAGLIAAAALVVLVIGDHVHSQRDLYRVATAAAVPLHLWVIVLGSALCKGYPGLTPNSPEH